MFWIDDPLEPRASVVMAKMTREMSDLIWCHYFTKEKIREMSDLIWCHYFTKEMIRERHDEELKRLKGKNKREGSSKKINRLRS